MRSRARALIDEEFAADTTVADALPATGVALRQVWRVNPGGPVAIAIAVPARDEAARIGACIRALAVASGGRGDVGVVVFVNNATDATVEQAVVAARTSGCRALVVAADTAPALANAGWSRRIALDLCYGWLGGDGVLMTTDADGRVAPDWIDANLAALAAGAHLVCGRIEGDPVEAAALPAAIHAPGALEGEYLQLAVELDARLDPRAHDPWPHHGQAAGASLALRARDYISLGRLPTPNVGEDRAMAALAARQGLTIRHSETARVTVSCRTIGRAPGGMACAIAARIADANSPVDEALLPAAMTARRAICRRDLRAAWADGANPEPILRRLGLTSAPGDAFGVAWAEIEAASPRLRAPRLRPDDLLRELPMMRRLIARVRG